MKEINCNVIKDILPLYVDHVVSQDTRELVGEHLESCDECRTEAELLQKEVLLPDNAAAQMREAAPLKKFKKDWRNKKVIISLLSAAVTAAVLFGIFFLMTCSYEPVAYDPELISIEEIKGEIYAHYHGRSYAMVEAIELGTVELNGEEKKAVAFFYADTFWSKHVEPLYQKESERDERDFRFSLGSKDELDAVYYYPFFDRGCFDKHLPLDIFDRLPGELADEEPLWGK